jgi:mycothiol synthase
MNTNFRINETILAPGLKLRPAKWNDAEAVAQLIHDSCAADGDAILAVSADELKHGWQNPDFNLERDAFVIETTDSRIVGYDEVTNSYGHAILSMDGNAHPECKGLGIGTTLLRAVEKRAREIIAFAEPHMRAAIRTTISRNAPEGIALHEYEGYQPVRYHWRMEIVLNGPPELSRWPVGIALRPFDKDQHATAVWQAENEAFRDHPGSTAWTLEDWQRERFDDPEFDPSLWAVAWDRDEVAGFSVNRYRMGIGWIRSVGVRRPWRKRGIAEALLLHSFGEYYGRGTRTIGLGVQANNPTGATRLYQRVGMHPASEHVTYEKVLRAGHAADE